MTAWMRGATATRSGSAMPGAVPRAESLFEPVRDRYGWRLALVFGNHAPGGFCPYYAAERCFHCDIGAGEGAAFDHATNRQRLAWFREHYQPHLASISHLVLYNSGSVLNPREMPPELLDEIVRFRPLASCRSCHLTRFARGLHQAGRPQADPVGPGCRVHGPSDSRHRDRPTIGYEMRSFEKECLARPSLACSETWVISRPNSDRDGSDST